MIAVRARSMNRNAPLTAPRKGSQAASSSGADAIPEEQVSLSLVRGHELGVLGRLERRAGDYGRAGPGRELRGDREEELIDEALAQERARQDGSALAHHPADPVALAKRARERGHREHRRAAGEVLG